MAMILVLAMLLRGPILSANQDDPCHSDEVRTTDSYGSHCAHKLEFVEWNANDCVRDFKPTDRTKLIAPFGWDGKPDLSRARLENFDFKLAGVCGVKHAD